MPRGEGLVCVPWKEGLGEWAPQGEGLVNVCLEKRDVCVPRGEGLVFQYCGWVGLDILMLCLFRLASS